MDGIDESVASPRIAPPSPPTSFQTPAARSPPVSSSRAGSTRTRKQRRTYSPSSRDTPANQRKKHQTSRPSAKRKKRTTPSSRRTLNHDTAGSPHARASAPRPQTRPPNYLETPPHHLFVTQRQHRPELWQFVRLAAAKQFWHLSPNFKNEHAEFAYCTRCSVSIPFKTSNHQVLPHMEKYHEKELYGETRASNARGRSLDDDFADAANELREISSEEQAQVNKLLAKWIAGHFRPLILIEDQGFIDFVVYITQVLGRVNVPLPKRTQLRGCIIALAKELRNHVKTQISKSCEFFSVTADIWTARNGHTYISFTVHYIDEDFYPRNWTLEVKEIPGQHTGELIATFLEEIMDEWGLDKERCTRFVRDSGSNMIASGNLLGLEHISCLAHDIHLVLAGAMSKDRNTAAVDRISSWSEVVVSEPDSVQIDNEEDEPLSEEERAEMSRLRAAAIKEMDEYLNTTLSNLEKGDMETIRESVQQFRSLAVYFRRSPKARNRLAIVQADNLRVPAKNVVSMIVDCPTRWNSCYQMLERCIRLEPALSEFFTFFCSTSGRHEFADMRKKLSMPKHKDWLIIKCLCLLLKPFGTVSTQLGGQQYPTLPLVLPALCGLKVSLENRKLFDPALCPVATEEYAEETRVAMEECRKILLKLFTSRFAKRMQDEPKWVAFLDPRIAGQMMHLKKHERDQAIEDLVTAAVELSGEQPVVQQADAPTVPDDTDDFMKTFLFGKKRRKSKTAPITTKCRREIQKYLAELAVTDAETSDEEEDAIKNPFDWWRGNQHKYRFLSRLARKWLGTVATSVASERAFSTSGNIITVKRCSLKAELVRDLVFIAENSRRMKQQ